VSIEDHFDVLGPDDVRIRGHRIGIETVIFDYLDGLLPVEIALRYPTLSLEEIGATIEYYERNQRAIDAYLREKEEHMARMLREQDANPPPVVERLRALARERQNKTLIRPQSLHRE